MEQLEPHSETMLARVRQALVEAHPSADPDPVAFLAAGEYTFNYRFKLNSRIAVLRIVTGSQMGLDAPAQALYEAHALKLLSVTGRVPEVLGVEDSTQALGYPYLLLEYLPGRPLQYRTDLEGAARCVAAIHQLPIPPAHGLQVHADPVASILAEASTLLETLDGARWEAVRALGARVASTPPTEFAGVGADQSIINTDLNSHNFIVDANQVWLIDWEKARVGATLMDLAHFLLPTTTLWRDVSAAQLSAGQRETFIAAYLDVRSELDAGFYRAALRRAMQLAAVRAVSWCAWSVAASERGERPIENEESLAKSRLYTTEAFLDDLIDELWG